VHLERLRLADVALDTLNYNGHTTTTDALWAGIPVVAALGGHFASRVSASLLRAMALDELVAGGVEQYVDLAVRLGRRPEERARLRDHIAAMRSRSRLFDTDRAVADLERAYDRMWAAHRSGKPPTHIEL
jgi:protein O-GlcNAc transferase